MLFKRLFLQLLKALPFADNNVRTNIITYRTSETDFQQLSETNSFAILSFYPSNVFDACRFDQCPISPLSMKGIKDAGYEKMTIVQEATLPVILKGSLL